MFDFTNQYLIDLLFGVMLAGMIFHMRKFFAKLEKSRKDTADVQEGIKCMLRDRIVGNYEKCIVAGVCSLYLRENLADMYDAYKALGGNGAIDHLMDELNALPTITREKENE